MRKFQSLLSDFQRLDTQVLGASTDAAPSQGAFAGHCGLAFPLVSDFPKFEASRAFGVFNEETIGDSRVTFVIDKEGVVRHIVQDAQSMEQHAEESLEAIKKFSAS